MLIKQLQQFHNILIIKINQVKSSLTSTELTPRIALSQSVSFFNDCGRRMRFRGHIVQ